MRLLIDNCLSHELVDYLPFPDFDCVHVRDIGLGQSPDVDILAEAARDHRIIVSADSDFGALLAVSGATRPSYVSVRRNNNRRVGELAALLRVNLLPLEAELAEGAVVVIGEREIRLRRLPLA
ncbi:MAG: DUF5615 family PIN-like protein [Cellulomonadaceae bacterium]|jgi:predicted nuclease of predicted toxin-antitoxin system|nr:DUF5615 family PIN-like protein [Cellulomonadaceae bacterium]